MAGPKPMRGKKKKRRSPWLGVTDRDTYTASSSWETPGKGYPQKKDKGKGHSKGSKGKRRGNRGSRKWSWAE